MDYLFSNHAIEKILKRKIPIELVEEVMHNPEQKLLQNDKTIFQSIINTEAKEYLLRVFVDTIKVPNVVITVYLTNKITKYWRVK